MRNNVLDSRHRALGSDLGGGSYNDMAVPWSYASDPFDEVAATRTRAGLFDLSAVLTARVGGPEAAVVVDHLLSCDCQALAVGSARVASELNDAGHIVDDVIVLRAADDVFLLCHGGGATPDNLRASAEGRDANVRWEDDLNILAVQGPRAAAVLQPHCAQDLFKLSWFEHVETTLFGCQVRVLCGGFTGEHGIEIYCRADDAGKLWDAVVDAGRDHGLMPGSWTALNTMRTEAGLLFYPLDMPEGDVTPWEVGLGWTIATEGDYRGRAAVLAARGKERFRLGGIWVRHEVAVEAGATILVGDQDAGLVTSPIYSRFLMQSVALAHLKPAAQALGTTIQVKNPDGTVYDGNVVRCPFYDPMRLRITKK
ncbi:aminomethyltransferase family protein [Methylonatrum kenyense]|uniref:aminomethyltransferase family protein n=1 Tax=Methylonatrum kenyense TaxID=455253 RepID=UPI0020C0D28C|nr:aminomethyltransferase family protein [Methylonatrum kenyense]MCK8516427.1 aminomethyltransferase family protein [Methylonatrum kenyense]